MPLRRRWRFYREAERRRSLMWELTGERTRQALTQEQVAAGMGTSQSAVARFEAGETDVRLSTVQRHAMAVGKRLDWVIADLDQAEGFKEPAGSGEPQGGAPVRQGGAAVDQGGTP